MRLFSPFQFDATRSTQLKDSSDNDDSHSTITMTKGPLVLKSLEGRKEKTSRYRYCLRPKAVFLNGHPISGTVKSLLLHTTVSTIRRGYGIQHDWKCLGKGLFVLDPCDTTTDMGVNHVPHVFARIHSDEGTLRESVQD